MQGPHDEHPHCEVPHQSSWVVKTDFVPIAARADPPRPSDPRVPWNIRWTAKVRYKSTAGAMLGMPAMGMGAMPPAQDDAAEAPAEQPKKKKRGGLLGSIKDAAEAAGAIPH